MMRRSAFRLALITTLSVALAVRIVASGRAPSPSHAATPGQETVTVLTPGAAAERELAPGDHHDYQVTLTAGQWARFTLEQRGMEIVVELFGPDDSLVAKFNDEVRPWGEQEIAFVAGTAGLHTLVAKAKLKGILPGSYSIRFAEARTARDDDRSLLEARKLQARASLLVSEAKYAEALPFAERALAIADSAREASQAYVALLSRDLASIYWYKGEPAMAKPLFEHALAILEQELGPEHPQTAFTQSWLGSMYRAAGEYDRAEQAIRHALAVIEKTLGPEHPWVADSLKSLGVLYADRGDYDKAEQSYLRALTIVEKTVGNDTLLYGQLQNNLGVLFNTRQEFARAGAHLERALAVEERLFGPDNIQLANVLQNLGSAEREQGNYVSAEQYYWRALSIRERAVGPEHPDVAANLINIANLYHSKGDDATCLEIHFRALKILEKTAGQSEWVTILSLGNIARTYAALGDLANAVAFQARVEAAIEQDLSANLAVGSERQKLDFLDQISERTERTVSLNLQLAPDDPDASSLAALVLLQRKGRVLDAMTDSLGKLQRRADAQDQALLQQLKDATAQLARLALNGPRKTPRDAYQKRIEELEDQKEELEAEVSRHSAEFRAESQPVTLESVQAAIPDNAVLLEFVAYRPFDPKAVSTKASYGPAHYAVYVIRKIGAPQGRDLGDAASIQEAVVKFREALRDPLKGVRESARRLDAKIMQPVRHLVGSAAQLLISPDGDLNLIPFQALLDEEGHYLLQRHAIGYLTTGRDLLRMQITRASKTGPLVMADPSFGEPDTSEAATVDRLNRKPHAPASTRRSITTAPDLSSLYFAPLSGTSREARAIQSLFPEAHVLAGLQAAKQALQPVDAPSILHIATHGFFLRGAGEGTRNPLLRAGLALAGANLNNRLGGDGILTALEAANLNLWGTKLVTLSACDTGVGEVKNGEGVYGLRRAFFLGGAETLVMSLWPVGDAVTRELMTEYYSGLKKGLGRGEALRQAQLAMQNRNARQHPFYWAAFIQAGEWANLDGRR